MGQAPIPNHPADIPEERAVRWLITNTQATYPAAAAMHGVSIESIRSRIEYRYGSIGYARELFRTEADILAELHRCVVCREPHKLDHTLRCKNCRGDRSAREGDI